MQDGCVQPTTVQSREELILVWSYEQPELKQRTALHRLEQRNTHGKSEQIDAACDNNCAMDGDVQLQKTDVLLQLFRQSLADVRLPLNFLDFFL